MSADGGTRANVDHELGFNQRCACLPERTSQRQQTTGTAISAHHDRRCSSLPIHVQATCYCDANETSSTPKHCSMGSELAPRLIDRDLDRQQTGENDAYQLRSSPGSPCSPVLFALTLAEALHETQPGVSHLHIRATAAGSSPILRRSSRRRPPSSSTKWTRPSPLTDFRWTRLKPR